MNYNSSIKSMLFSLNSKPYGLAYSQWIVKWWRWLLSIPKKNSPVLDLSGELVSERQVDPNVWFLAGTLGGHAFRRSNVPLGKAVLMPIINYESSFADEPGLTTEEQLTVKCKTEIDDIMDLWFSIDGLRFEDLSQYRIRSPLFDVDLCDNNILNLDKLTTKMISDGYWVFLKPLKTGSHKLISSGSCRSGKIKIGTTCDLYVHS